MTLSDSPGEPGKGLNRNIIPVAHPGMGTLLDPRAVTGVSTHDVRFGISLVNTGGYVITAPCRTFAIAADAWACHSSSVSGAIDLPYLSGLALALALGLLVGVQRGWAQRKEAAGTRFAGVRTFGLIGLAGGFAGAFHEAEPILAAVVLASGAVLVLLGYWRSTREGTSVSGTASLVALLTLACGYLAGSGEGVIAAVASGLMVLVLSMRRQLHGWVASLSESEISAIARFGLIALVILPLLPDTPFGPYDAWRARQLWLVVVMVCGFSLLGYLAAKHFGATRGVLATAAAGSMVSSTAVTAGLAGQLGEKAGDEQGEVLHAGIALASAMMFLRVMLLCGFLAPFALPSFSLIALPGMVVSLVFAFWHFRQARAQGDNKGAGDLVRVRNPFDLGPALLLTALVMVTTVIARWVLSLYGNAGLAIVLAATGSVDVDSAIITMGNLAPGTLEARVAGLVLAPPVLLNTLFKAGIALSAGWRRGSPSAVSLFAAAAASGTAALIVLL